VPPEHVRLDEVHEHEARLDRLEELNRLVDALDVRLRRVRLVDVLPREDVADLADAVDGAPALAEGREIVRLRRLEREVVPVPSRVASPARI
jgi:hypothetical protein